ncbi:MAG: hypothetical protein H0W00_04505 [Chloroflexi bacterium]|nr:hypothetical protein [Chloroflexota bacterium]
MTMGTSRLTGRILGLALALSITLPALAAGSEPAERPWGPAARVPLAQVGKGLDREVYGFFHPGARDHMLRVADYSVLSTVAYFAIPASGKGRLKTHRPSGAPEYNWTAWNSSQMDRIIDRAHAAGTKVVLTVTRFGWSSGGLQTTQRLLSSATARQRLAGEIAAELQRRGVDGVNIDFEPIPGSERQNFVRFIRTLRTALDAARPGLDLSVAATGYVANYDIAGLTAPGAADSVFIMAYHYRGSWSPRAGSIAPLTSSVYDVTDTVDKYTDLAPPGKIILGLPYYGYTWSTKGKKNRSRTLPAGATYGYPRSTIVSSAMALAEQHGRRWDPVEQGPWVRWQFRNCPTCPLTWRQLYYEDEQSLGLKYDLINDRNLRGVGIWALGYEGAYTGLNEVLRDKFVTP